MAGLTEQVASGASPGRASHCLLPDLRLGCAQVTGCITLPMVFLCLKGALVSFYTYL